MIRLRKALERGHADHGWLRTWHTFSFSSYQDPRHVHFRALRVMNEDIVQPGGGFDTHPHHDMEIVTYVLSGALEHRDSLGHGEVLQPGEFQRMSAGTGIEHSEFNPSPTEPVHLYQVWLFPERRGLPPSYEQKRFDPVERHNRLRTVASPDAADGSLRIHTDACIALASLDAGRELSQPLAADRHAWLQVLRGSATVNGLPLNTSDGAALSGEAKLDLRAVTDCEVMLFDLG